MFNLIITVISIALTGLAAVASINYFPLSTSAIHDITNKAELEIIDVQKVYNFLTKMNDATPAVLNTSDGGFTANFIPVLKFQPTALKGYTWSYGKMATIENNMYSDLNFICISPIASNSVTAINSEALTKLTYRYPNGQIILTNAGCSSPLSSNVTKADSTTSAVVFLRYIPQ